MTDRIVKDFQPLRVLLFGSHARGDANPYSDIDLLIVFPQAPDKRQSTYAERWPICLYAKTLSLQPQMRLPGVATLLVRCCGLPSE